MLINKNRIEKTMINSRINSFIHSLLLACLFGFSPIISAMEPAGPREHVDVLEQFVDAISTLSEISYADLISFLASKPEKEIFQHLLEPLTRDKQYGTVTAHYLRPGHEFLNRDEEKYLFHGTRSTIEIVESNSINARFSMSGYGVFFGRNFYVSKIYCSDYSSNIHQTWKDTIVRSVMILKKDKSFFKRNDNGGTKEYILDAPGYSLDNLIAIVFEGDEDVINFERLFANSPNLREQLKDVDFYVSSVPLTHEVNLRDVKSALVMHRESLFHDVDFVSYLAKYYSNVLAKDPQVIYQILNSLELPLEASARLLANLVETNDKEAFTFVATYRNSLALSSTPLSVAIMRGNTELVRKILMRINKDRAATILASPKSTSLKAIRTNHAETLTTIADNFRGYPQVKLKILHCILDLEEEHTEMFASIFPYAREAAALENNCTTTLAIHAAARGHFAILRVIAEKLPESLMFVDEAGESFLFKFSLHPEAEAFEKFLTFYELAPRALEVVTEMEQTIAHVAADKDHLPMTQFIANKMPDFFSHQDHNGETPLHCAKDSSVDVLAFIAKKFPETLRIKNRWGEVAITTAARCKNFLALEFFAEIAREIFSEEFGKTLAAIRIFSPEGSDAEDVLRKYFPEKF